MNEQKRCIVCGEEFSTGRSKLQTSPECRRHTKPVIPEPEPEKKVAKPEVKTVDRYCRRCIYLTRVSGEKVGKACDYIGHTGRRRPCPAGTGCTVRKTNHDGTDERGRVYRG